MANYYVAAPPLMLPRSRIFSFFLCPRCLTLTPSTKKEENVYSMRSIAPKGKRGQTPRKRGTEKGLTRAIPSLFHDLCLATSYYGSRWGFAKEKRGAVISLSFHQRKFIFIISRIKKGIKNTLETALPLFLLTRDMQRQTLGVERPHPLVFFFFLKKRSQANREGK